MNRCLLLSPVCRRRSLLRTLSNSESMLHSPRKTCCRFRPVIGLVKSRIWNCDTLKFFRGSRPLQHRPQLRAALEISALPFHSTSPFLLHHHHPAHIGGCVAIKDQKMAVATYAYPVHVARLIAWCKEAL